MANTFSPAAHLRLLHISFFNIGLKCCKFFGASLRYRYIAGEWAEMHDIGVWFTVGATVPSRSNISDQPKSFLSISAGPPAAVAPLPLLSQPAAFDFTRSACCSPNA